MVVRIVFRVATVVVRVFKVLVRIGSLPKIFRILVKIFRVFAITVRITVRFAGEDGLQDCLRGSGRIFKILARTKMTTILTQYSCWRRASDVVRIADGTQHRVAVEVCPHPKSASSAMPSQFRRDGS